MRTLIINASDRGGGAAIAGYRLHSGLLKIGVDSHLAVGNRTTQIDERVHVLPRGSRIVNRLLRTTLPRFGLNSTVTLSSFSIARQPYFTRADVVNYHILHETYFNFLALPFLTKNKPSVLTLHDMWPVTGHCIYSFDCERWRNGCGRCPYPQVYPPIKRDATHFEWRLKKWIYKHSKLQIVTISRWMNNLVRDSILSHAQTHLIPNGVDLEIFVPREQAECRRSLELPANKRLILFAAADASDPRKGGDLLIRALNTLPPELKKRSMLVIMGYRYAEAARTIDMECRQLGFLKEDRRRALVFNAVDMFAFPTRADNLPVTLQESMACGTPMVSFDVGGVSDLVRKGETGFVAPPENIAEFARHVAQLLNSNELRERLSRRCREIALSEYSVDLQARRYLELFEQLAVRPKAGASV